MNEEEFLKEHPSLVGTIFDIPSKWISPIGQSAGYCSIIVIEHIHETQLDKKKVIDAIERIHPMTQDEFARGCLHTKNRLKMELKLE